MKEGQGTEVEAARVAERALSNARVNKMKVESEIASRQRAIENIEHYIDPENRKEQEILAEHQKTLAALQQTLADANIELERAKSTMAKFTTNED